MAEEWTTKAEIADTNKQAFSFYKNNRHLVMIRCLTLTPRADEKMTWIMQAYGHVLSDVGIYTPKQFAEKIAEAYDVKNTHNGLAFKILMQLDTWMIQEDPNRKVVE